MNSFLGVMFLIMIMVQGCAMCDDLYPVSVVNAIAENLQADDIKLRQQKQHLKLNDLDTDDINWFKTNIVDRFGFVKETGRDEWKAQPTFQGDIGTPDFSRAAERAKTFFDRNNDWETTKKNPKYRTEASCINLLYITAARYLLVTHILYEQSGKTLGPCQKNADKKVVIPSVGECYPAPFGSATCTSDYDVFIAGKNAGILLTRFNDFFQDAFRKPSELVFDTNLYAFTMAYAFPVKFEGLPKNFAKGVAKSEETVNFKMQELASAYYKVFKYNQDFFKAMSTTADVFMDPKKAYQSGQEFKKWMKVFDDLNKKVKLRIEDYRSPKELREVHNGEYQWRMTEISKQGGYKPELLGNLAMADLYAPGAYHTRGALRFVVGGMQMEVKEPFSTNDLWVTMIENWGEANKEFNHCQPATVVECFLKMSKYMWRTFYAMRLLRDHIPASDRPGLVNFGQKWRDPEFACKMWLDYKKQGRNAIPKHKANVQEFLRFFLCNQAAMEVQLAKPFPLACLSKINDKVNAYNEKMVRLVADESVRPPWRP